MFTHVILRAIKGDLGHNDLVLKDGQSYVLGRAGDCAIRLNAANVSRHHCRLDVYSPAVLLRDLGSLNGTLLNGEDIGHRESTGGAEQADEREAFALAEGDVLRVGDNLFWIDFIRPSEDETDEVRSSSGRRTEWEPCC